ncbi:hypothetical protein FQN54_006312 [Arachnomyces sp. PD_36]|nr:hypothetical protein FQN54_006312 [Arachnomyces sp. PD_36]
MTSAPHTTERPPSSLSDSWATLSISDTQSEDDARSEQTDAASLIEQSSPDDVTSLDERGGDSETEDNDVRSEYSESQDLPPLFHGEDEGIEDSSMTAKPGYLSSSESIEFEEPERWPEAERVELKHTIHVFDDAEIAALRSAYPPCDDDVKNTDRLVATVQQTMTKRGLDVNQPFRVLYVGDPAFRHIILDKIGDVLVSSPSDELDSSSSDSSRFHVVPTSFGSGLTPNYAELLPIHVQLVVDDCISATSTTEDIQSPNYLNLFFKNRPSCSSTWTGSGYQVTSSTDWTLPDMAIFFISDRDDSTAQRTRHLAQTFTKRHAIPSMIISEQPLWHRAHTTVPVDFQSLHICLESRDAASGESRVLKRYPIDLKTFESIMPGQLNRNLASLSGLYAKEGQDAELLRDVIRPSHNRTHNRKRKREIDDFSPLGRFGIYVLACVSIMATGYTFCHVMLFIAQFLARSAGVSFSTPTHPNSLMNPSSTHIAPSASVNSVGVSMELPTVSDGVQPGCPLNAEQGIHDYLKGLANSIPEPTEEIDEFQVYAVGDCHLIVRPPQRFSSMRKAPKFDIKILRGDEEILYTLSKLFDGVYTVKLGREDAHGSMNVSISTKSKPRLNQTSEVDFGTPWLKMYNWKKAAKGVSAHLMKDLSIAQTGLSEVYSRLFTDMQVWVGDAVKKADLLRRETELLRKDSVQRTLASTTGAVMTTSKRYSGIIKKEGEKQLATVSAMLSGPAQRINRETLGFTNEMWATLQYRAKKISEGVRDTDLSALRDKFHEASRSRTLALAQSRARQLLTKHSSGGSSPT